MLRCYSKIVFKQNATADFPTRAKSLTYNFIHEFEANDTWSSLTNKAKITLPKNVSVRDERGILVPLNGTNINLGGFSSNAPLFMRGDRVTIDFGYTFFDKRDQEQTASNRVFEGYISMVGSKKPIEIECEDNAYKLKQIRVLNKVFPAKSYSVETMLAEMLQGSGFTVRQGSQSGIGDFRTQNETVADVLGRIKKDYHFESYFRGNELRVGFPIYVQEDILGKTPKIFQFQKNIISDDLQYKRLDDLQLSAIAYSINKNEIQGVTKSGHKKTKHERLEVLVTVVNGKFVSSVKPSGQAADFAPDTSGERRTFYFWNVTTAAQLTQLATERLQVYYYSGLRGKFTTFGLPYVRQGDNVQLKDDLLPERNGVYKVKSVTYKGGVSGHRQEIELDFKVS